MRAKSLAQGEQPQLGLEPRLLDPESCELIIKPQLHFLSLEHTTYLFASKIGKTVFPTPQPT